ncbi:MAG: hypothetical protein H6718_09415 [Polyangiaceae bacterium]|nr:hypothetical protein [Myxococcales bacterium]MCB9585605.1 hypothetical protein [Polyangiaceae bacterium]MCB9606380.1 hypothetical protein [Polyangiaceae bacterium]
MAEHTCSPAIELGTDVGGFFREAVDETLERGGYEASEATVSYVGALLADYAKPGQLNQETLARPVTLLLNEAKQAKGYERFERLRTLGDGVLYISSFFREHLERRGVEVHYIYQVGASAYESASVMMGRDQSGLDVFGELSHKFEMFTALLSDVAEKLRASQTATPSDVLKLYERWTKTGSARLAEELARQGLTPVVGNGTIH